MRPWVRWSRAAEGLDAVHLTVAGYLTAPGQAVPVADDTSWVLAGWDPDKTYRLTDVAHAPGVEQRWVRADDDAWHEERS